MAVTASGSSNGSDRSNWKSPKELSEAVKTIGIPGAIAIFVVYIGATEIPKMSRALDRLVNEVQLNREQVDRHIEQMDLVVRIARQGCRNAAKDEDARRFCD
jgi:hypothetical protein